MPFENRQFFYNGSSSSEDMLELNGQMSPPLNWESTSLDPPAQMNGITGLGDSPGRSREGSGGLSPSESPMFRNSLEFATKKGSSSLRKDGEMVELFKTNLRLRGETEVLTKGKLILDKELKWWKRLAHLPCPHCGKTIERDGPPGGLVASASELELQKQAAITCDSCEKLREHILGLEAELEGLGAHCEEIERSLEERDATIRALELRVAVLERNRGSRGRDQEDDDEEGVPSVSEQSAEVTRLRAELAKSESERFHTHRQLEEREWNSGGGGWVKEREALRTRVADLEAQLNRVNDAAQGILSWDFPEDEGRGESGSQGRVPGHRGRSLSFSVPPTTPVLSAGPLQDLLDMGTESMAEEMERLQIALSEAEARAYAAEARLSKKKVREDAGEHGPAQRLKPVEEMDEYELRTEIVRLEEELEREKEKAKDEAEDLTQEMAELRFQLMEMVEQERDLRQQVEHASLKRVEELEAQVEAARKEAAEAMKTAKVTAEKSNANGWGPEGRTGSREREWELRDRLRELEAQLKDVQMQGGLRERGNVQSPPDNSREKDRERLAAAVQEAENLRQKIREYCADRDRAVSDAAQLQRSLDEASATTAKLSLRLERTEDELLDLRGKMEEAEAAAADAKEAAAAVAAEQAAAAEGEAAKEEINGSALAAQEADREALAKKQKERIAHLEGERSVVLREIADSVEAMNGELQKLARAIGRDPVTVEAALLQEMEGRLQAWEPIGDMLDKDPEKGWADVGTALADWADVVVEVGAIARHELVGVRQQVREMESEWEGGASPPSFSRSRNNNSRHWGGGSFSARAPSSCLSSSGFTTPFPVEREVTRLREAMERAENRTGMEAIRREDDVRLLQRELKATRGELLEAHKKLALVEDKMAAMQAEIVRSEAEATRARAQWASERGELEAEVRGWSEEARREVERREREVGRLEARVGDLEREIGEIESELRLFGEDSGEGGDAGLRTRVARLERSLESMRMQLREAEDAHEGEVLEMTGEAEGLRARAAEAERELFQEKKRSADAIADQMEAYSRSQADAEILRRSLQTDLSSVKQELAEKVVELELLRSDKTSLSQRLSDEHERIRAVERARGDVEARLEVALEQAREVERSLEMEKGERLEEIAKATERVDRLESELRTTKERLESELADARVDISELTKANEELAAQAAQLEEARKETDDVRLSLRDAEERFAEASEELRQIQERVTKLEDELQCKVEEIEQRDREKAELANQVASLEADLTQAKGEVERAREALEDERKLAEEGRKAAEGREAKEVDLWKQREQAARAQLEAAREDCSRIGNELSTLKEEISAAKEKAAAAEREVEEERRRLEDKLNTQKQAEKFLNRQLERLEGVEEEKMVLQTQLKTALARAVSLEKELSDAREAIAAKVAEKEAREAAKRRVGWGK